ncbi:Thiopurine S-methyltransferase (TPMT) [Neorhodopirellula lusitana]|uniref:Thiopurine S-methyltransferase (TPMT) n=1 Tax=Neorhodopirellula lusitana TaxID=445327 RepID=A0ABY1Q741_9BACT|nr:methyltransferase domain-containing protein [Neorhodopirellula lusitana]SMP60994.1 Thiopurine S-methyltransferase (TPMT) [Neorhodopirellula lusitana]
MSPSPDSNDPRRPGCHTTADLSRAGWQKRYDAGKTGWDRGAPNPMLATWLNTGKLQPCDILVPGCGRGHEVIALADAGFDVTAIDFADGAVQSLTDELKRRNLKAKVVQSDIFAFSQPRSFDAIYEQTSLCAIHPNQWQKYQQLLAGWLRAEGTLFAMFMQCDERDDPPYSCPLETMQVLFSKPAWHWHDAIKQVEHPTGMHELACVLTRTNLEK